MGDGNQSRNATIVVDPYVTARLRVRPSVLEIEFSVYDGTPNSLEPHQRFSEKLLAAIGAQWLRMGISHRSEPIAPRHSEFADVSFCMATTVEEDFSRSKAYKNLDPEEVLFETAKNVLELAKEEIRTGKTRDEACEKVLRVIDKDKLKPIKPYTPLRVQLNSKPPCELIISKEAGYTRIKVKPWDSNNPLPDMREELKMVYRIIKTYLERKNIYLMSDVNSTTWRNGGGAFTLERSSKEPVDEYAQEALKPLAALLSKGEDLNKALETVLTDEVALLNAGIDQSAAPKINAKPSVIKNAIIGKVMGNPAIPPERANAVLKEILELVQFKIPENFNHVMAEISEGIPTDTANNIRGVFDYYYKSSPPSP